MQSEDGKTCTECKPISPEEVGSDLVRHRATLRRWGMRMSGCPDVAEDLAQEVLLLAFLHRDQFRGHSDIRTWLYTIARRAYSRMIRLRAGQPRTMIVLSGSRANSVGDFPPRELCDHREDPYERMCRIERQASVRDAIARLPPKLRLPLTLKYLNEVSIKEVAALLEVEENTVKTRLHRARRRLALDLSREAFSGTRSRACTTGVAAD